MVRPSPIWLFRLVHMSNLEVYLQRHAMHAPNHTPEDGLGWTRTHRDDVQARRAITEVPCGPGGSLHDYVPLYFGRRSPMLYQLHTGWVPGYEDGQETMVYLVLSFEDVAAAGLAFVFTDGHACYEVTTFHDDPARVGDIDMIAANAQWWRPTADDPDLQRRKQAEFLIHRRCPWDLVRGIAVVDEAARDRALATLSRYDAALSRDVIIRPAWYY